MASRSTTSVKQLPSPAILSRAPRNSCAPSNAIPVGQISWEAHLRASARWMFPSVPAVNLRSGGRQLGHLLIYYTILRLHRSQVLYQKITLNNVVLVVWGKESNPVSSDSARSGKILQDSGGTNTGVRNTDMRNALTYYPCREPLCCQLNTCNSSCVQRPPWRHCSSQQRSLPKS